MNKRIADIEVLRGFAVLFVVIHHANGNLITWETSAFTHFYAYFGGWFGVDLFFAISGFVIARDLVPRLQASTNNISALQITLAFWLRRAWRLLPSAWLWLGMILLATLVFNQSGAFGTFRTNFEATIAAIMQVANVRFAESFMRWEYGSSFHYWSLSLEEQFYLLFPLLIILSRRFLPYVLLVLVLAQIFSTRSLMFMSFRTDALALGVLLALWSRHPSYQMFKPLFLAHWRLGAFIMCISFVCMSALGSDQLHIVSIRVGMIALLSALLVWVASYDCDYLCKDGFLKRLYVWAGTRSYAIYLIHIPAFLFTREIWYRLYPEQPGFGDSFLYPFILTAALLTIMLSELNYRLVECPLRIRGSRVAARVLER